MIATADELIDALGGTKAAAEIAGVGSSAVSNWRKAGKIPPRLYLKIAAAARERGVHVPEEIFRETPSTAAAGQPREAAA